MKLSGFILENINTILQEWEEFAATLVPVEQKFDAAMLRDHAKQMLETIAVDLACPQTAREQVEKSKSHAPLSMSMRKSAATTHGSDRHGLGFSLNATVSEYRALRASVTRLWQDSHIGQLISNTAIDDLIRFNEAIDQALNESMMGYSFEKEQQSRVFDTILSSTPDLSWVLDINGRFLYANKALMKLLELPQNKIIGKNYADLGLPNATELQRQTQQVINSKTQFVGESTYTKSSGKSEFFEYIFAPVLNNDGVVEAIAGTARDITERKAAEHNNWYKANYDLLTGLPNRRLFRDRLEHDVKHAARIDTPLALLFIDLDHFKEINDMRGHDAGDLLLRLAAERIRACVRETDTVARLGGDEFTVILQDLIDAEYAEIVAEKIVKELANPFKIANDTVRISTSIGIAIFPQDGRTYEHLIRNADQAMYAAKNAGRNRFHFFSPDLEEFIDTRLRLIADLRIALARHQFSIYYQPIFDMADGRIVGAEALLRWIHPRMGLMLPERFIGPAEDTGLMDEIDNWVFSKIALHSLEWSNLLHRPFQIGINMSAAYINAARNKMKWEAYIKKLGLALHSISVEIKEEVLSHGSADLNDSIATMRHAGIDLAVDNFGVGYSSIAYLKKNSVDIIKIDQSLVHDLTNNSQTVIEAIIVMAHKLEIKVIAKGVETKDQRDKLQAAGCDYAQGFFWGAPAREEEFRLLLKH